MLRGGTVLVPPVMVLHQASALATLLILALWQVPINGKRKQHQSLKLTLRTTRI